MHHSCGTTLRPTVRLRDAVWHGTPCRERITVWHGTPCRERSTAWHGIACRERSTVYHGIAGRGGSPTGTTFAVADIAPTPSHAPFGSTSRIVLLLALCFCCVGRTLAQTAQLQAERFKNLGVAYLEEHRPAEAERAFRRVIELASDEALGYANLGVAQLRLGQLSGAASQLEQARRVAPTNVEVLLLGAEAQYAAGRWGAVTSIAKKVLDIAPSNAMARYYIYRAARAQRDNEQAQQEAAWQIDALFRSYPENVVVVIRYARQQAKQEAWKTVSKTLDLIQPATQEVVKARAALQSARKALAEANGDRVHYWLAVLENVLRPTMRFRQDLSQLQPPVAGLPILRFSDTFYVALSRERPHAVPVQLVLVTDASIPEGVRLTRGGAKGGKAADRASHASLDFADIDGDGRDEWLLSFNSADAGSMQLWQDHGGAWRDLLETVAVPPAADARFVDLNDDGVYEIVAVGSDGTVVLQQDADGYWKDRLATWEVESLQGRTLELVDVDNEGDLDLCVAGRDKFVVWQNRPNQTFLDISQRSRLSAVGGGVRQVLATDHDDDLDTDLIVIGRCGQLQLWDNRRHGLFSQLACGLSGDAVRSVLARDVDNDGFEDLVVVSAAGELVVQRNRHGVYGPAVALPVHGISVIAAVDVDIDNDGWVDLAVAGRHDGHAALLVLRNRGDGTWAKLALLEPATDCVTLAAVDYDRDGDLDLVALDRQSRLQVWRNDGGNANHWLRVRLKGLRIAGSKNSLRGLGSKLEIKAGLFYEMQYVRRPVTHFGLGTRPQADVLRVVWSNGVPQNRFRPVTNQTVREVQVLKGSCPYLYCWDGTRFVFVTDTLAGAPLGLQVAEGVVAPDNPRELVTIPREKITGKEGEFVFQYTSELWETVYLDQVALWVVDHRQECEVFTDQRFLPPPYGDPELILTRSRIAPRRAEDTAGRDVTTSLLEFDHSYPESLHATRYQGIVAPHCLTLSFGDISTMKRPTLVLGGWIFWTDTSINVAVSQDPTRRASPTTLEYWDPQRGWQVVNEPFGLPCGKDKWVVIDVAKYIDSDDARVRIRSESQIYWDQAFLADRSVETRHRITKLTPVKADLHFGGFNELYRPGDEGPHLYRYGHKTNLPVWMDMTGLATRYGDVEELLGTADDRFVIFTGGDEVTIRFDAGNLPGLLPGWQRSFLFYSDGWEKDSDRNTLSGETVEPLPFHGMSAYPYPPTESYPNDQPHHDYRRRYNTRHIGPERFRSFVREHHDATPELLPWDNEPRVRGDHSK